MTRTEFVKAVATAIGTSQKAAKETIDTIAQVIVDGMKNGEDIKAFDGITFSVKHVDATQRRNPATGETFLAPAKEKPVCKFGKAVKDYLNDEI